MPSIEELARTAASCRRAVNEASLAMEELRVSHLAAFQDYLRAEKALRTAVEDMVGVSITDT